MSNDQQVASFTLSVDGLLPGAGWYPIERDEQGYFRWLGPENQAVIYLAIPRNCENRLNLVLRFVARDDLLDGLTLDADNIPLVFTRSQGHAPIHITTVLPRDPNKPVDQPTVLTFRTPGTVLAAEINPGSGDQRYISLALQAIHWHPQTRPLFVAEKFADPQPFNGLDYLCQHQSVRDAVIHGLYRSAYDYYINHPMDSYNFELHERFDECPGDLFDILANLARAESAASEQRLRAEIDWLRDIVRRQGDELRALKNAAHIPATSN
ncbi:MAG: hypothetical protein H6974_03485 [Gammaproteobacteria bacterium]|nr:hypothetical protein [Gammaproteobacteria bacterium]